MLGHDVTAALPELRAHAESRMLDTFEIGTYGSGWVYDDMLGREVREFLPAFTTKGRVKVTANQAREVEVGARTSVVTHRELSSPVDSPEVPDGMVARCVAVDPSSDPTLLGAVLELSGPAPGSQTTARRIVVKEVVT